MHFRRQIQSASTRRSSPGCGTRALLLPTEETEAIMMNAEQRRAFVREHRTCIFAFQRKEGPPSMSVVYYTTHGDDILIATMSARAKAKAIQRLGGASIWVPD